MRWAVARETPTVARRRVEQVMVRRFDGTSTTNAPDEVVVEEPLEIRLNGDVVTTTMRTPGHDFELAAGFCSAEGLLDGTTVRTIRYCGPTGSATVTEYNVVTVETVDGRKPARTRLSRTNSSCGLCGADAIAELTSRLVPLHAPAVVRPSIIERVLERTRRAQDLFTRTGSVHGAAAFGLADGEIAVLREDIGRHNAADKVIGRLLLDGRLPASDLGLFLSGRVSLEMVQKAWAAGLPVVVSVGGPSSLAVDTARVANITLIAFAREGRMNVYCGSLA
jgi:FdhD protein